jgi:hypothetical protein
LKSNQGLRDWIANDANLYDPEHVHVNSKSDLSVAGLQLFESHFFTCYSLIYDEDGDQIGYDKTKTFSYEYEMPVELWQISGNTK